MSEQSTTPPGMDIAHEYIQTSATSQSNDTSSEYITQTLTPCMEDYKRNIDIHVSVFDSVDGTRNKK